MLILSHRGLTAAGRPENTLAAVDAALSAGADGVEVDLRVTADGVAVCCHDADLERVAGVPGRLQDMDYADVQALRLPGGGSVPRVAEVLDLVRGRGRVNLDVKAERGSGARPRATGSAAATLLTTGRWHAEDTIVSSFDPETLAVLRDRAPRVPRALLTNQSVAAAAGLEAAVRGGHQGLHPHVDQLLATPEVVECAHERGLAVRPWTVNRGPDVVTLRRVRVDAIITDDVVTARGRVAAPQGRVA